MITDPRERLEAAHEQDPRDVPYGVFIRDPWPAGVGMFFWYRDAEAREAALLDEHHLVGDGVDEWPAARGKLSELLTELGELRPDTAERSRAITDCCYHVEWWGTFEDLARGGDEFSVDVRDGFLDEDGGGRPVSASEDAAFVEHVRHYGF